MRKWAMLLMLLWAVPAMGQDDEPAAPPPQPTKLVAAAWCPLYTDAPADDAPGCDLGLGIALYNYHQLAAVAAIGTKTVGVGLAWVVASTPGERPIAVSLGAIAPYDERGIDVGGWGVAVGATFGFGGGDD